MSRRIITAIVLICTISAAPLLTGCARKPESPFKPIPASALDQTQLQTAERVGFRTLSGWRDGTFEPLSDDFTQQMKDALPSRTQREAYGQIKAGFGDFQSMEFAEAVASEELPNMVVYRFRGTFSETKSRPEVRVVLDGHNKVSGFWCKLWMDTLQ